MTVVQEPQTRLPKVLMGRRHTPVLVTLGLFVAFFAVGSVRYDHFLSGQVMLNLFIDNGYLLVVATGMTFVILTGGIDLSVGSVVALSAMLCAWLVERHGWPPLVVIPLVLVIGTLGGTGMGAIIHYFEIQPFIVTLAGMFLARGLCYTISTSAIPINNQTFTTLAQTRIHLPGDLFVSVSAVIAVVVVFVAFGVLHYTRLGRNVYAVGGNEQSALLMGLPVARTKVGVYAINGFCSGLAGVLYTFFTLSGDSLHAIGQELDAIAAVVIGGTVLTGGSGYVLGTALGVLVLGTIQSIISFQATLSSWWSRIVVGSLLLVFIVLQRVIGTRKQ